MNRIIINSGTTSEVIDELTDIFLELGFVETEDKFYWDKDTNRKFYYKFGTNGTNVTIRPYKMNDSTWNDYGIIYVSSTVSNRLTYEKIGDGIIFGITQNSNMGDRLYTGIMAPVSPEDDWMYFMLNGNNGPTIANGFSGDVIGTYGNNLIYTATGVQVTKVFSNGRFQNNLFVMPVGIQVPGTNSANTPNFLEATIGNDSYVVIELAGAGSYLPIAVKRVSA